MLFFHFSTEIPLFVALLNHESYGHRLGLWVGFAEKSVGFPNVTLLPLPDDRIRNAFPIQSTVGFKVVVLKGAVRLTASIDI